MKRTAITFGVWTAFCMLVAIAVFFSVVHPRGSSIYAMKYGINQTLSRVLELAPYCVPAGIVAGIGWWLLHRREPRHGWLVYGLFALAVLLVNHVLILGFWGMLSTRGKVETVVNGLVFAFMIHGWITVPVALIGTYLFVVCSRRRLADFKPR